MSSETLKLTQLVDIFNALFLDEQNTRLQVGAVEPFYQAPKANQPAVIYSRDNYFSSALHEIAHWCIAGEERRQIDDFGYWYNPEGRTAEQQSEFESVEIKPQAIEWALSMASNHQFHFSADNLSQQIDASESFKQAVRSQLQEYLQENKMPHRAKLLFDRLQAEFADKSLLEGVDV